MKVIIISGPTASGKTKTSLELGLKLQGEIVNFDSLLFYKEINIGTAKPNSKELELIPHHLINIRSIQNPINASDFYHLAIPTINNLLKKNKVVFLVGGAGFYLQAILKGMFDSPTTPQDIILKSDNLYSSEGIEPFLKLLEKNDPESFKRYHSNDHYRIRRAVEHWWTHQIPLSSVRNLKDKENKELKNTNIHGWDTYHIHLDIPKDLHFKIIQSRTHNMIKNGLLDEVRSLLNSGFSEDLKPLQSIGYKEAVDFIKGNIQTISELEEKINISTRQLAKSQRTWFKKIKDKKSFNPLTDENELLETAVNFLNN